MLVGQFGNVEIIVDEEGQGGPGGTGRNDGCRRVHDLRDSRVKRAFPPHSSPGLILADTLSTGFMRVTLRRVSSLSFFSTYTLALGNIGAGC